MSNLIYGSDLYGMAAQKIIGVQTKTTMSTASGKVNLDESGKNHAFPFLAFIALLVAIRVFEGLLPEV